MSGMTEVTEETLIFEGDERNRDVVRSTWEAFSEYIVDQLEQKKPVTIPQFGKFTFLIDQGGSSGTKVLEPVFVFNEAFLRTHAARARSIPRGTLMPQSTDLNYAVMSSTAGHPKHVVVDAMKQLMRDLGQVVSDSVSNGKLRLRANVYNVGKICCNNGMVKFAFSPKWGCTRPGTNETCRTSFSRSSAGGSRAGRGLASSREMNAAMRNAVGSRGSGTPVAAPRKGYGDSELATIEELRAGDEDMRDDSSQQVYTGPEETPAYESPLVDSVMEDKWEGDFNEGDVENLLQQDQSQMARSSDASGASDVLPVYLCPEMTRSSRRIQRQKEIVAKALQDAYSRFDSTVQNDLQRVSKENQLFEAELRRQTQAANELRAWRKSNLLEQRKTHELQMAISAQREDRARADRIAPVVGYIDSRMYVDDGRQKILAPHQKTLHKTLKSQVETRKIMAEEAKEEVTEYEQLQNELLMQDMELRQSYVREAAMNEGSTLRDAWDQQLKAKRKLDVVSKINDDIITNVGPQTQATSWLPEI